MGVTSQRTFCRICEAHCGIVVDVETDADGSERVVEVHPDRDHPVSKGFTCVKGAGLPGLHHDPDRIDRPMKRVDGELVPISWDQATREIGAKIREIVRRDPAALSMYLGNPGAFSFQTVLFAQSFLAAFGSPNLYTSLSIDTNTKFLTATEVFGSTLVHPVPDFDHTQFLMCLGSNPAVSQMSVLHAPNALARLQSVTRRGGRVVIVDPRRTETAAKVGEHVFIRPGTDAYFLLGILHILARQGRLDLAKARRVASGVDELVDAATPWTPERVARLTGIDAAVIEELALAYADADGAVLYMSTGISMGPFGSIAYWVAQGLQLLTGNLDRRGGTLVPEGPFNVAGLTKSTIDAADRAETSRVSGLPKVGGGFPAAALAEEILTEGPGQIKAMVVVAGNPLHSIPGGRPALDEALGGLDLLVAIDLYESETAHLADYVLPAADMLERSDYPFAWMTLQPTPHAQWTPKVVEPLGERREEWEILSDIAVAAGVKPIGPSIVNLLPNLNRVLRLLPGSPRLTPDHVLSLLLLWGRKTSLRELRRNPGGVMLPPNKPGTFLGRRVPSDDGLVHLAPRRLVADLARLDEWEPRLLENRSHLVMIGRRERRSHNSWMHNNRDIRQPSSNTALLHPDDAGARGIVDGDLIEVRRGDDATRSVTVPVKVTKDVLAGVVVVPHGWDHSESGLGRAGTLRGANPNHVIPGGVSHTEPPSGQAIMLGHRVEVALAG